MHNNFITQLPIPYFNSSFLPNKLSSTILWLDSTDPNNNGITPANNSLVTNWVDKSTSGLVFSQATTSNKPQNKNAFVNNKNMIYFGNNGISFLESTAAFNIGSSVSISIVFQTPTLAGAHWLFETTSTPEFYIRQSGSVQGAVWNGAGDIGILSAAVAINQTYILTYIFSQTSSSIYLNGVLKSSTTFSSTSASNNVKRRVGNNSTATANFTGYMGDLVLGNKAWNTLEQRNIEMFLGNKWGISV